MNEWPAAVWAAVGAMIAAMVLVMVYNLGALARQSAQLKQEEENAIAMMREYRQYYQLDGAQDLLPQDVISAIAESGGTPEIWVDTTAGPGESFDWRWTRHTLKSEFAVANLVTRFSAPHVPPTARYDSVVVKDLNGAVTRIEFRRQ